MSPFQRGLLALLGPAAALLVASPALAGAPTGELTVADGEATLLLVVPTGWLGFADDDRNGMLSDHEIVAHAVELERRLGRQIWLASGGRKARAEVGIARTPPASLELATDGHHATLAMVFSFAAPPAELTVHDGLFSPGVSGAMASWRAVRHGHATTLTFTPEHPDQLLAAERAPGPLPRRYQVPSPAGVVGSLLLALLFCAFMLRSLWRGEFRARPGEEQDPHA